MSKKEWVSVVVALVALGIVCIYAHGCGTMEGIRRDVHNITIEPPRSTQPEQ